ncbi:MAG: hypothetical protein Kow00107_01470 [Planctomycetota bacterium]
MRITRRTFKTTIQLYDQSVPLISKGDSFGPNTPVAKHFLPPPRVFYLSVLAGLTKKAMLTAKVKILVSKGDEVAYKDRLATVTADFTGSGSVKEEEIRSPLHGIVEEVIENSGNILIREILDPSRTTETVDISASLKKRNLFSRRISIREGSFIEKGEMLPGSNDGVMGHGIESPISGIIRSVDLSTGKVVIERKVEEVNILAGFYGEVEEVGEKALTLSGEGDVLYGRTGIGPEGWGRLEMAGNSSLSEITAYRLAHSISGKVLCGYSASLDALEIAAERGAAGIVAAYARHGEMSKFAGREIVLSSTGSEKIPYPIVVTEGFGKGEPDDDLYRELRKREGWWTYIRPATQMRAGVLRPTVLLQNIG